MPAYRIPAFLVAETARFEAAALSVAHLLDSLASPLAEPDEVLTYSGPAFDVWAGPDAQEAAEAAPAYWGGL